MKIKMGQVLKTLNGDTIKVGVDAGTITLFIRAINDLQLGTEINKKIQDKLGAVMPKDLTLAEVCCNALITPHDDDKGLSAGQRTERMKLAMLKYNRAGFAKVAASDVALLEPLITRAYVGSLVAPQALAMLRGEAVEMGLQDGDEPDEDADQVKAE